MNRKIKFRFWDKQMENMSYSEDHEPGQLAGLLRAPSKWIIKMQYTGLQDKDGKYIYEGDILEEELLSGKKERFAVRFVKGSFVAESPDEMYLLENINDLAEVIGNKFQDPDLAIDSAELK